MIMPLVRMNSRCRASAASVFLPFVFTGLFSAQIVSADTVGYYRFENGAVGDQATTIIDSSGKGFNMRGYDHPAYGSAVPASMVPQTGQANTRSMHFSGRGDIYSTPGEGLSQVVFKSFTIETYVRFDSLKGWQTMIGRDDVPGAPEGSPPNALFYLSKSTDSHVGAGQTANGFRVELHTNQGASLTIEGNAVASSDTWYHVAAVGDAATGTLSLYVDGKLAGSTNGFTGLLAPRGQSGWTLGRGQYKGRVADKLLGDLDEVRFSDTALPPAQFLNAPKPVLAASTESPKATTVSLKTDGNDSRLPLLRRPHHAGRTF